jgi:hypothetical protein
VAGEATGDGMPVIAERGAGGCVPIVAAGDEELTAPEVPLQANKPARRTSPTDARQNERAPRFLYAEPRLGKMRSTRVILRIIAHQLP